MKQYQKLLLGLTGTLVIFSVMLTAFFSPGSFVHPFGEESGQTDAQTVHAAAVCQSPTKPLNPETVTAQQLTMYGLPPRPAGKNANLTFWRKMISMAKHRLCPTPAQMKGVKRVVPTSIKGVKAAIGGQSTADSGITAGQSVVGVTGQVQPSCTTTNNGGLADSLISMDGSADHFGAGVTLDTTQGGGGAMSFFYYHGDHTYLYPLYQLDCKGSELINISVDPSSQAVNMNMLSSTHGAYIQFALSNVAFTTDMTATWGETPAWNGGFATSSLFNFGSVTWSGCQFQSVRLGVVQSYQSMGSGGPTQSTIMNGNGTTITHISNQTDQGFVDTYTSP